MIRKKGSLLLSGMLMLGRGEPQLAWFGSMRKPLTAVNNQSVEYKEDVFDVAVIGGGSGGISFSFEANKLGLSTVLLDYVKES